VEWHVYPGTVVSLITYFYNDIAEKLLTLHQYPFLLPVTNMSNIFTIAKICRTIWIKGIDGIQWLAICLPSSLANCFHVSPFGLGKAKFFSNSFFLCKGKSLTLLNWLSVIKIISVHVIVNQVLITNILLIVNINTVFGAVVIVPVKSVSVTTKSVSSNPAHGEVYLIQH